MPLKLLLTDASNAIGSAIEHELEREAFNLFVPKAGELDWHKPATVTQYVRLLRPDVVINCAGWEDIPNANQQAQLTLVASQMAAACLPNNIPLIHLSSYKVFGGDNKSIHSEKDIPEPNSDAGRAFLAAEQIIEQTLDKWICLRLSWVVGSYGENHLTRLLRDLLHKQNVTVSSRLRGAPTALSDAARVAVAIAKQISCGAENWGVMHYCTSDAGSEAEFADQVMQVLMQQHRLPEGVTLNVVDQLPENEPVSAVLNSRRVRDYFGVQARTWRPSLLPMIKQWLHKHVEEA
jgi:dTDP-4-dehydrorhamnose reductase